jgi:uracil-DNA glycosylase
MQRQGQARQPSNRSGVPATDDEIREKYLERAIRELNAFARRLGECPHCPRGQLMPVLGSGHPQADIFMVKHSARPSEVAEGVEGDGSTAMADPACVARVIEELAIVQPRIMVVMGEDALAVINELGIPLARELVATPGELQRLTPSIEALYVPNIDEALDEESAKREFWAAFRELGQWWADLPPY